MKNEEWREYVSTPGIINVDIWHEYVILFIFTQLYTYHGKLARIKYVQSVSELTFNLSLKRQSVVVLILDFQSIYQKRWKRKKLIIIKNCSNVKINCFTGKKLSPCNELWFSYPYIFANRCLGPWIFPTMNYI